MNRHSEPIGAVLLFFGTWWALTYYPLFEDFAFLWTLALWSAGWVAIRMFSSTVHRLGFWGWVLLLEVAAWYVLAGWLAPLDGITKILLLWGVATPLLMIGNVWRRAYDRFPPVQGLMHGALIVFAAVALVAVHVLAWRLGPDFMMQMALAAAVSAAAAMLLYYGWRLGAPPPGGHYDARLGTMESFRRRGISHER